MILEAVEIEVNNYCNRQCRYCPNSLYAYRRHKKKMPLRNFEHICREIAKAGFAGRLSLHLYNEPLLVRDLDSYIRVAARLLPFAFIALYTNGDFLDDGRYGSLLEAGVYRIIVTRHCASGFPERPFQIVQTPEHFEVSNRGGAITVPDRPLTLPCFAPSEMLIVDVDGNVLLCHEDAGRANVFGNLLRQPLSEIWHSELLERIRGHLARAERHLASPICGKCDCRLNMRRGESI